MNDILEQILRVRKGAQVSEKNIQVVYRVVFFAKAI